MSKVIFEEIVEHANVCLKRWHEKGDPLDWDDIRSLILTWLNRGYIRVYSNHQDYRVRKQIAKGLNQSLSFSVLRGPDIHITTIVVADKINGTPLIFPDLDYEKLNRSANERMNRSYVFDAPSSITFDSITKIKFH